MQGLSSHEKLDAQLLSHLVGQLFTSSDIGPMDLLVEDQPTPFSTFSSLLPGPTANQTPPVCPMGRKDILLQGMLDDLFVRFANNNFAIHSHLVTIAHGIFPLASRLFNHSCVPNAVARYVFEQSEPARMEVVALRDIKEGEEVRIRCFDFADTYLDLHISRYACHTWTLLCTKLVAKSSTLRTVSTAFVYRVSSLTA